VLLLPFLVCYKDYRRFGAHLKTRGLYTTTGAHEQLLLLPLMVCYKAAFSGLRPHLKTSGLYTTTGSSMCPKWPGHSALPSPQVEHLQLNAQQTNNSMIITDMAVL
jgi:hypothetical protein